MKNKLILASAVLASTLSSSAALVYSTNFTGDDYTQTSTAVVFDNGTTTAVEEWFGSTNGIGIADGDLTLGNTTENRFRGAGVWLNASTWAAGTVTVEFDAANFTAGTDSKAIFQAYAANNVDASNTVSLDLHGNFLSADGLPVATGSASIALLGTQQEITGNGNIAFTFTYNGTDDFIGLVFANLNAQSTGTGNTVDIDNLTVSTIPEPGTYALLAGLTGLAFVMVRRRRA
ncbi:PEP-CTERM sorting domain-containing protein [Coraliomargarita algicola]|uniref:PEP-CTERM sorting domain-containing protein n=1 Tax=Coraliomargarita algicola TaxID=3092156 RepID=A0ABZ0RKZ0_9BACT|nr:PEP-CTERM sorting domain-containing protein [Coraliomargarita sp. J2-16]WPJ95680.1 PEP-CTERM sorting domain-containing protein [Coraliomargarita sp. J2-16]